MRAAKKAYTIEEAAELLKTNELTIRLMLSALKPGRDLSQAKKLRTAELERISLLLRQRAAQPR